MVGIVVQRAWGNIESPSDQRSIRDLGVNSSGIPFPKSTCVGGQGNREGSLGEVAIAAPRQRH